MELAAFWRVHRYTVARHLRDAGVEPRSDGIDAEQLIEAVQLYGDGWSIRRLAAQYDRSYEAVRRALLREAVCFVKHGSDRDGDSKQRDPVQAGQVGGEQLRQRGFGHRHRLA